MHARSAKKVGREVAKVLGEDFDYLIQDENRQIICTGSNLEFFEGKKYLELMVEALVEKSLQDLGHPDLFISSWGNYQTEEVFVELSEPIKESPKKKEGLKTDGLKDPPDFKLEVGDFQVGDKVSVDLSSWEGWTATIVEFHGNKVLLEAKSKTGRPGKFRTQIKNLRKA